MTVPELPLAAKIDRITLYRVDVTKARHFSHGSWNSRQHLFVQLSSGTAHGWGEWIASVNSPEMNVRQAGNFLRPLLGQQLANLATKSLAWQNPPEKPTKGNEAVDFALWDVIGQALSEPTLRLFGAQPPENKSVPGLACVLQRDPAAVRTDAAAALAMGMQSHLKVKLFGDEAIDVAVIRAAREIYGPEAYLVGDVNCGYRTELPVLAAILRRLHAVGLSACEDPAELNPEQWVALQAEVQPLDLIPDAPLRPASHAVSTLLPGIGNICNLHPGCMGSLPGTLALGARVREIGAGIMIGDDSLIGPGTHAWQHIAVAIGARWVEAIEKPAESTVFHDAILRSTAHFANGIVTANHGPGFGLAVDENKLRATATAVADF